MIHYYQPSLWPFLQFNKKHLPLSHIQRTYFHSFEDGLWALLPAASIKKNSVILIPDFYCEDVVKNIRLHGYQVKRYRLDHHFQIDHKMLLQKLEETRASVVILFHAAGITNHQVANKKNLLKLCQNYLVIEDCVQRLVDPSHVALIHPNHVVMDSLRKVSPLPGSYLYYLKGSLSTLPTYIHTQITWYQLSSLFVFFIFRWILELSYWLHSYALAKWTTERLLVKTHDEIIGDGVRAQKGIEFWAIPLQWFDFKKVETKKTEQVAYYEKLLDQYLHSSSPWNKINIPKTDYAKLHVYPLGVQRPVTKTIRQCLHEYKVLIWDKFPDCPWSRERAVFFLPLGFHLSHLEQEQLITTMKKFIYPERT